MLTPDFAFCHTVTMERYLGREISENRFSDPVTLRGRVNLARKRVRRQIAAAATEVVAEGTVFLPAGTLIAPGDRLTFSGRAYSVLSAQPCYDWTGAENHLEVTIQ